MHGLGEVACEDVVGVVFFVGEGCERAVGEGVVGWGFFGGRVGGEGFAGFGDDCCGGVGGVVAHDGGGVGVECGGLGDGAECAAPLGEGEGYVHVGFEAGAEF